MASNQVVLNTETNSEGWTPEAVCLREKIQAKTAIIGVIGLGYVGLPLAIVHANAGFHVIGVDYSGEKVDQLNAGKNYIPDVSDEDVKTLVDQHRFQASLDYGILHEADVICIAVPTPLTRHKDPDLSFIEGAAQKLRPHIRPGQLIVLESTTYPGTTEDVLLPIISDGEFVVGKDVFLAFSPERVDPGNATFNTANTPKLVGGVGAVATELATLFYSQAISQVVPVSSPRIAEMAKVFENTYRAVNIALVNEMAMLCDRMKLDVWEVLDAAGTKPFGIQIFYPGPGVGGHCIPLDPFYLAWKAKEYDMPTRFIDLAGQINQGMPYFVVDKLQAILNRTQKKPLQGSKILLLGIAYKRDTSDARESPALQVLSILAQRGANVAYHDPWVSSILSQDSGGNGVTIESIELSSEALQSMDAVVITTDHSTVDYGLVEKYSSVILDTRNIVKDLGGKNIFRL